MKIAVLAFLILEFISNSGFSSSTRCINSGNLEVCIDGECSTAPCMGGYYCIENLKSMHSANCEPAELVSISCADGEKRALHVKLKDRELDVTDQCPQKTPSCYKGDCVYQITAIN